MDAPETLRFWFKPEWARKRFHLKSLTDWLLCAGIFAIAATVIAFLLPISVAWLVDGALIAVFFYLNFFVLPKMPIKFVCSQCFEDIVTNVHWICPSCTRKNIHTAEYPFVNRCEYDDCRNEAAAYKCHHCDQLVFLTSDKRTADFAYCADFNTERSKKVKRSEKVQGVQETLEDKRNEVAIAELDAKLREIDAQYRPPKIKSPAEQKEEQCERDYQGIMGVREYCRRKKAEVAEKYKNDPGLLEDATAAITEVERRHS